MAPAGTPAAVVDKLNRAMNEALRTKEDSKALAPQGIDVVGGSPEEFARSIDADVQTLGGRRRDGRLPEMIKAKRFALAPRPAGCSRERGRRG